MSAIDKAIELNGVDEVYRIKFVEQGTVHWEQVRALQAVDLCIHRGESVAVIGPNGAGKTTFLKLVAGMLTPDKGKVHVSGKVASLLDLGAGFHPEFTGRENIALTFSLFGHSNQFALEKREEVIAFAGIGRFIDAPVKYYSQGMLVRLGFAIASFVDADILLIDDTVSVGDRDFQHKAFARVIELKKQRKTILCVTHDMDLSSRLCERGLFLLNGKVMCDGPIGQAVHAYIRTPYPLSSSHGNAHLVCGKMGLYMNEGQVSIAWDGRFITSGLGFFIAVRQRHVWHFSKTAATWERVKSTQNSMRFLVTFLNGRIKLHVDFAFVSSNRMLISLEKQTTEQDLLEYQFGIMCGQQYARWFEPEEGNYKQFASFSDSSVWVPVGYGDDARSGVAILKEDDPQRPLLVMRRHESNVHCPLLLLNSGTDLKTRIVRFAPLAEEQFYRCVVELGFMSEEQVFADCLGYSHNVWLQKGLEFCAVLKNAYMHVQCSGNKIEIVNARTGKLLAQGVVRFVCKDKEYSSLKSIWVRTEHTEEGVEVWYRLADSDMCLVWNIDIATDTLWINLFLNTNQPDVVCSYVSYVSIIPAEYDMYVDTHPPVSLSFGMTIRPAHVQRVRFVSVEGSEGNWILTFGSPYGGLVRRNKHSVEYNAYQDTSASAHGQKRHLLRATMSFSATPPAGLVSDTIQVPFKIQNESMELLWDEGRIRLFYQGKELTSGLGLYSSFLSHGIWYDSTQGLWQKGECGEHHYCLEVRWAQLPIIQYWEVQLKENVVCVTIKTQVLDEISIEEEQVCLMASLVYTQWYAGNKKREFFSSQGADASSDIWEKVGVDEEGLCVGLVSEDPREYVDCQMHKSGSDRRGILVVQKSSKLYNSRVLQWSIPYSSAQQVSGAYTSFQGKIMCNKERILQWV